MATLTFCFAESGHTISLINEESLEALKQKLHEHFQINPNDQILLYGPNFRALEKMYGSKVVMDNLTVFVYDKRVVTESSKLPSPINCMPARPTENTIPLFPLPLDVQGTGDGKASSVAKYILDELDRLSKVREYSEQCLAAGKQALLHLQLQLKGIEGTILTVQETFKSFQKSFEQNEQRLSTQQSQHGNLILNFEASLQRMQAVQLDPLLREFVVQRRGSASPLADPQPAAINTLYDCINADKERAALGKCAEIHYKVEEDFRRIKASFADLTHRVHSFASPASVVAQSGAVLEPMEEMHATLLAAVGSLQRLHRRIVEQDWKVSSQDPNDCPSDASLDLIVKTVIAYDRLQRTGERCTGDASDGQLYVGDLYINVGLIVSFLVAKSDEIEAARNSLAMELYRIMRKVGQLQSEFTHKLREEIEWMKKWTSSRSDYFMKLKQIAGLPKVYSELLGELARRNHYNKVFDAEVGLFTEKVANMRANETKQREIFMSTFGRLLPPIFFESIPSLKEKPPYFSASLTEKQRLPDIQVRPADLRSGSEGDDAGPSPSRAVESGDARDRARSNSVVMAFPSLAGLGQQSGGEELSALDALALQYNQLAYEHAILKRQLAAKEQETSSSSRRDRGASMDLTYGSTFQTPAHSEKASLPLRAEDDGLSTPLAATPLRQPLLGKGGGADKSTDTTALLDLQDCSTLTCQVEMADRGCDALVSTRSCDAATEAEEGQEGVPLVPLAALFEDLLRMLRGDGTEDTTAPEERLRTPNSSVAMERLQQLVREVGLAAASNSRELQLQTKSPKVSIRDFRVGDVLLFIPTSERRDKWLAFHNRCPHHYLSEESVAQYFRHRPAATSNFLGRVHRIEVMVASAERNPFLLPLGTEYYVCHAHPLTRDMLASSISSSRLTSSSSTQPPGSDLHQKGT